MSADTVPLAIPDEAYGAGFEAATRRQSTRASIDAAGIDGVPDPAGDAWLRAETAGRREVKRALQARAAELRGVRKAGA